MNANDIQKLKTFIDLATKNPNIIHTPELDFFKQYLINLGATIPEPTSGAQSTSGHTHEPSHGHTHSHGQCSHDHGRGHSHDHSHEHSHGHSHGHGHCTHDHSHPEVHEENEPEEPEHEKEETPLFPDDLASQEMGNRDKEITEEASDKAAEFKQKAIDAQNDGNIDGAIEEYTNAIKEAPSAFLYANRAQLFLQQNKPNTAIRDCDEALVINPDSAKAYKIRGKAYKILARWEESAKDLRLGNKLDWDEGSYEIQKFVEDRIAQVNERRKNIPKKKKPAQKGPSIPPAGAIPDDLLEYLQDPTMGPILQEIMQNPDALNKYRSNPKVMEVINKISSLNSQ
jgi:suppressor of tumorigenicity protein 13